MPAGWDNGWDTYSDRAGARAMPPQIPRTPQAGDLGWGPDLQEEAQDAEQAEAGRHGRGWLQEARVEVLLAEDRPPLHWAYVLYLRWTRTALAAQCWWCWCQIQTRDHLSKVCLTLLSNAAPDPIILVQSDGSLVGSHRTLPRSQPGCCIRGHTSRSWALSTVSTFW